MRSDMLKLLKREKVGCVKNSNCFLRSFSSLCAQLAGNKISSCHCLAQVDFF